MLPAEVVGGVLSCLDPLTDWQTIARSGPSYAALLSQGIGFVDDIRLTVVDTTNNRWLHFIVNILCSRITRVSLVYPGEPAESVWTALCGRQLPRLRSLELSDLPYQPIDPSSVSKVTSLTYKQTLPLISWSSLTSFIEAFPSLVELRLTAGMSGKPANRSKWLMREFRELHIDAWCFQPVTYKLVYDDVVDAVDRSHATLSAFSYHHQASGNVDTLLYALNSCKVLHQLSLSSVGPLLDSVVGADSIPGGLESLTLKCSASADSVADFAVWLKKCSQLRRLSLSLVRFDADSFVNLLIPAIIKLPKLNFLCIEGFDVPSDGWWKLAEALPTLRSLSLWGAAPADFFDKYPLLCTL